MIYLTIAWALATLPVFVISVCAMDGINLHDYRRPSVNALASLAIFVVLWWDIYFLIRWSVQ